MFSAAVTDVLLENHIHFAYVNGVSSGSMTAMNYVSRQNGRMLLTTKTYLHDKRYMGPVSYTHLDVYKRQVPTRTTFSATRPSTAWIR